MNGYDATNLMLNDPVVDKKHVDKKKPKKKTWFNAKMMLDIMIQYACLFICAGAFLSWIIFLVWLCIKCILFVIR